MSMNSYPFDSEITGYNDDGSPIYDRAADSTILASMIHRFFGDGIVRDDAGVLGFAVEQIGGMTVKVNPGFVVIQGRCADSQEAVMLAVEAADSSLNRIDTIVLRRNLDNSYRNIDLYVVKGEASLSPVAPVLTRNQTVWELGVANIYISAGASLIGQVNIYDTRLDSNRCGICEVPMKVFDTTALYQQIQNDLELRKTESMQYINEWMQLTQDTLNSSTEGVLLNEIKANTYQTYAHSKDGTVHNLSLASGEPNIRFVATADFETGDTFMVNGTEVVEACMMNGTPLLGGFFISGAVVTCYRHLDKLYFIGTNRLYVYATLAVNGWVANEDGTFSQQVNIDGIAASDGGHADIDMRQVTADNASEILEAWTYVHKVEAVDGGICATCMFIPPACDVPIFMEVDR